MPIEKTLGRNGGKGRHVDEEIAHVCTLKVGHQQRYLAARLSGIHTLRKPRPIVSVEVPVNLVQKKTRCPVEHAKMSHSKSL